MHAMNNSLPQYAEFFLDDEDAIYPVSRITAGAVGEAGHRVFVLQAHVGADPISWVIDKEHAVALGRAIPELLAEIRTDFPELGEPIVAAQPNLALTEPLDPQFRVGSMGVSYDRLHDLVVLTLVDAALLERAAPASVQDLDEQPEQRVYTTRGQALLLGQQAEKSVSAGRPYCPNCGEPVDDFGHFCLPATARKRYAGEYLH